MRPTGRAAAIFMAALLALYLVAVGALAVGFLISGKPIGIAIGVALVVLPVLGAWALVRELQFGARCERLVNILAAEDALLKLPEARSGPDARRIADEAFPALQAAAVAEPESWRAWLRLSLGYDAAGDRRRARAAARRAIELSSRESKNPGSTRTAAEGE